MITNVQKSVYRIPIRQCPAFHGNLRNVSDAESKPSQCQSRERQSRERGSVRAQPLAKQGMESRGGQRLRQPFLEVLTPVINDQRRFWGSLTNLSFLTKSNEGLCGWVFEALTSGKAGVRKSRGGNWRSFRFGRGMRETGCGTLGLGRSVLS